MGSDHWPTWSESGPGWHSSQSGHGSSPNHPNETQHHSDVPWVPLLVVYIVGFVIATLILFARAHEPETKSTRWSQPWVPAVTRRDACAMPLFPVFFLLPAILWPLVLAWCVLVLVGTGLWLTLGTATTCCGIPIPRRLKTEDDGDGDGGEEQRDLEMGEVEGGEAGDSPVGGGGGVGDEVNSDQASVCSASSSSGSERPPSYSSLAPDEDGDGETDGLLDKNAK